MEDGKEDTPFVPRKVQEESFAVNDGDDISVDETLSRNVKTTKQSDQGELSIVYWIH